MAVHFEELTGIGLKETFTRNVDLNGKRLLNYMNIVCVNKSKKFLRALTKLKVTRGELSGFSEDIKEMVLLLLSFFDEKEDALFCYMEDTRLAVEVQMDRVHLTPTIVTCGKLRFFSSWSSFHSLFCIKLCFLNLFGHKFMLHSVFIITS